MKIFAIAMVAALLVAKACAADPLPSWNNTAPRQAIIQFVKKVTKKGSPDFVPVAERIATFDNDGTLWAEQPIYVQLAFALDRVKALVPQHPEWRTKPPFSKLISTPKEEMVAVSEHELMEIVMAAHAGITTEEFEKIVKDWIATARHPKTGKLYTEMVYQPMLELLAYLRANGFKTFIVSGGGIEFMRPWTERVYGIPPEQVVGSSGKLKFELRGGKPVLVKLPEINFIDDKEGKPVASSSTSAAAPSPPSATPTATCKCCNGLRPAPARASVSMSITRTRRASLPTTASRTSGSSTRASTKPKPRAGPS